MTPATAKLVRSTILFHFLFNTTIYCTPFPCWLSPPDGFSMTRRWNSEPHIPPTCMQWNATSFGSLRSWFPSSQPLEVQSLPSRLKTSFHIILILPPPCHLRRSISDFCTTWVSKGGCKVLTVLVKLRLVSTFVWLTKLRRLISLHPVLHFSGGWQCWGNHIHHNHD